MVLGEGGGVKRQIRGDAVTEVLIRDPAIVPWYGRIYKRGGGVQQKGRARNYKGGELRLCCSTEIYSTGEK